MSVIRFSLTLVATTLVGVQLVAQSGQTPVRTAMPAFKSSATQVAVTAAVRQPNGTPVTTLRREDFEIYDNGRPRPIGSFWSEPSIASVVVLFDRSGSMRLGNKIEIARDATSQLLGWLDAGKDEVSLLGFDRDVSRLSPFVPVPGRVMRDLENVDAYGTTALLDAMAVGAREVTERRTRRGVVVLTDGLDTGSTWTSAQVARLAAGIDVPVYVVVAQLAVDRETLSANTTSTLSDLAKATGGEVFVVTTPTEALIATKAIASDLHHQYLMAFASDGTPGWHALDVRVKQQKLLVRARTGYDAGADPASRVITSFRNER